MTVTVELPVLAVSGESNEADAQRVLNEKSARNLLINPSGVMVGNPALNSMGLPHDTSAWPKAQCNAVVVAEDGTGNRVELQVNDFAMMDGITMGGRITVTVVGA